MFKKLALDDLSFVTRCVIQLEAAICDHEGMDMISKNTQEGCGV